MECLLQKSSVLLSRCSPLYVQMTKVSLFTWNLLSYKEHRRASQGLNMWLLGWKFDAVFQTVWPQARAKQTFAIKINWATTEAQMVVSYVFSGAHNSADCEPSRTEHIWNTCNWHQLCIPKIHFTCNPFKTTRLLYSTSIFTQTNQLWWLWNLWGHSMTTYTTNNIKNMIRFLLFTNYQDGTPTSSVGIFTSALEISSNIILHITQASHLKIIIFKIFRCCIWNIPYKICIEV